MSLLVDSRNASVSFHSIQSRERCTNAWTGTEVTARINTSAEPGHPLNPLLSSQGVSSPAAGLGGLRRELTQHALHIGRRFGIGSPSPRKASAVEQQAGGSGDRPTPGGGAAQVGVHGCCTPGAACLLMSPMPGGGSPFVFRATSNQTTTTPAHSAKRPSPRRDTLLSRLIKASPPAPRTDVTSPRGSPGGLSPRNSGNTHPVSGENPVSPVASPGLLAFFGSSEAWTGAMLGAGAVEEARCVTAPCRPGGLLSDPCGPFVTCLSGIGWAVPFN